MKNLQFFKKISREFRDFFEILLHFIEFWREFGQGFRKFRNMHLYGVREAELPDASEIPEISLENPMETYKSLIVLMEILPFFQIS